MPEVVWRAVAGIRLRAWDDKHVVYNPLSGNTHILDIVTGEVLETIARAPARARDLRQRLADLLERPSTDGEIAPHVAAIVETLDALGLIEPARGC